MTASAGPALKRTAHLFRPLPPRARGIAAGALLGFGTVATVALIARVANGR
jgi:hypothetical protein